MPRAPVETAVRARPERSPSSADQNRRRWWRSGSVSSEDPTGNGATRSVQSHHIHFTNRYTKINELTSNRCLIGRQSTRGRASHRWPRRWRLGPRPVGQRHHQFVSYGSRGKVRPPPGLSAGLRCFTDSAASPRRHRHQSLFTPRRWSASSVLLFPYRFAYRHIKSIQSSSTSL